ncbi:hypothetical protein BS50DRAFT_630076 [Corynespora cassiicola Philippines]|uniref:Integral membrane protein TmpA n=1 Tax=Corynespora cassiicola Philippines TaxID=1448308 RepID=A0A2T2P2Q3_CORCC|nr:hypothetical protein BS50DRAFT_630076 [Corynespora cassiicola Philippines]
MSSGSSEAYASTLAKVISASSTDTSLTIALDQPPQLPSKRYTRLLRLLRYSLLAAYQRLFTLVILLNLIGVGFLRHQSLKTANLDHLATAASANILVAVLVRQDCFNNAIYACAWMVPWCFPLRVRRILARAAYTYGGIHSGAAVAGTAWFLVFSTLMTLRFVQSGFYKVREVTLTWILFALLAIICLLALKPVRLRYHNTFEATHRLLGWAAILIFWTQLLFLLHHTALVALQPFCKVLVRTPSFWFLAATTMFIIQPWLRLRLWNFKAEYLSDHALRLHFDHPVRCHSCLSISTSPLREWHPFATFPTSRPSMKQPCTSMVVSDAGDWTHKLIQSNSSPADLEQNNRNTYRTVRFWVKGTTTAGVLSLSSMFSRVVIVTTGSGVGPALSTLTHKPKGQVARLIWSSRSPLNTFGQSMLDEVERVDPDAVIIDTSAMGRPDLVRVAWLLYKQIEADAVFVLSNRTVTKKMVYSLESRGIPAFGPIWDS